MNVQLLCEPYEILDTRVFRRFDQIARRLRSQTHEEPEDLLKIKFIPLEGETRLTTVFRGVQ